MARLAKAYLKSIAPYGQSKYHSTEKLNKEIPRDYEARTWRERCHYDDKGQLFIPPMVFKNCLSEAAKFLSIQIPGKGKATYTKHFEAGVMVVKPLPLPIMKDEVEHEWLFVPSDGKRGGGTRVEKCFPLIHSWEGEVEFHIIDETITEDVFIKHLEEAGNLIGVGRFRPRNNGYYGRFEVIDVKFE
jgi:hypothetical protein